MILFYRLGYNNQVNIEGRILQSLRPRRDGVLLRADVREFGSATQVSAALNALLQKGLLERLDRGVYAKPGAVAQVGKQALLVTALSRTQQVRGRSVKHARQRRLATTADKVRDLAHRQGVVFSPTYADRWAVAVTKLAGDVVASDATDDLLVALTRAGKLTPADMVKLLIDHHRDQKLV